MSTLHELAARLRDEWLAPQISITREGCQVTRYEAPDGEHIELSTAPLPIRLLSPGELADLQGFTLLEESPPCAGFSKPLELAPDFAKERGRVWPWRS